jgi:ribonuclease BN (tRNA processing enzyme)
LDKAFVYNRVGPAAHKEQNVLKIIFLGTNGWYDTATGNTISIYVRTPAYHLIFDAGYGIAKLDQYLSETDGRPAFLFLSHFHLDHVAGLHTLAKLRLPGGLTICGPAGSRGILHVLVNQPFTLPLADLPYPVQILELPEESSLLPFPVHAIPLRHASLTLGFRIAMAGRVITYCADTGYCENAVTLSRAADLLIAECAYASGLVSEEWPHLNPETAARIAREAKARRLALVHFDAQQYPSQAERQLAVTTARGIFPNTIAALDGMEVDIA